MTVGMIKLDTLVVKTSRDSRSQVFHSIRSVFPLLTTDTTHVITVITTSELTIITENPITVLITNELTIIMKNPITVIITSKMTVIIRIISLLTEAVKSLAVFSARASVFMTVTTVTLSLEKRERGRVTSAAS